MQANQVVIEARHCNPLLQFHAQQKDAVAADSAFKKMKSNGAPADAASYEILAEVYTTAARYTDKLC